jgi:hypothetical protein
MTTHSEIVKALKDLQPNAQWTLSGDNLADLEWLDELPKPSEEAIFNAIANPLPEPEPTVNQKLASVGLTIDDLKAALGLGAN